MQKEAELAQLEQFVDKLLTRYNDLKKNHQELQASLLQTQEERDNLDQNLTKLRSERSEVKNRVSGLIGRIEEWENEQENSDQEQSTENESAQGQLFAMDQG